MFVGSITISGGWSEEAPHVEKRNPAVNLCKTGQSDIGNQKKMPLNRGRFRGADRRIFALLRGHARATGISEPSVPDK